MTDGTDLGASGSPDLLGCVLAGGRSTRFGAPKARARLDGAPLASRSRDALAPVVTRVVLVGGDTVLARDLDLDIRPDRAPGQGPLGALATALHWARDEGLGGVVALACDLPLVPTQLLARLLERWDDRHAVVPQSRGPLGLEPLCGAYPVSCLEDVESSMEAALRSMGAFLARVQPVVLPMEAYADLGEPEELFLNVNRPEDLRRVRSILAQDGRSPDA